MNKYKLPVLGLSLILLITSCKKNDVLPNTPTNKASVAPSTSQASEWKSLSNWTSLKGDKATTYTSKTSDSTITDDVAKSGLVLAFAKNNNTVRALPFQEKNNSDAYWYYQVSKGSISFSTENYSGSTGLNTNEFAYFVLSTQKIKDLELSGYTKSKLMQMAYSDVANLFKK